jgi:hypothetical protein
MRGYIELVVYKFSQKLMSFTIVGLFPPDSTFLASSGLLELMAETEILDYFFLFIFPISETRFAHQGEIR